MVGVVAGAAVLVTDVAKLGMLAVLVAHAVTIVVAELAVVTVIAKLVIVNFFAELAVVTVIAELGGEDRICPQCRLVDS